MPPDNIAAEEARSAFLAGFENPTDRNCCSQLVFGVIRRGLFKPEQVLDAARRKAQLHIADAETGAEVDPASAEWHTQLAARYRRILEALDSPLALDFAAALINFSSLSPVEQENVKHERAKTHITAWMQTQPPSTKQLEYLKSLGYVGPPIQSKAHASELIEGLVKGGRRG